MTDDVRKPTILLYALGAVPLGAVGVPLAVTIPQFYAGDLGVSAAIVGLVILAARITDVATDPVVGVLSDHSRTRFGRRKPFIAAGIPVFMLSVWMVFVPAEGASTGWLACWTVLLYLGWTLIELPYGALGAELSEIYETRTKLMGSMGALKQAAQIFALLVPFVATAIFGVSGNRDVLRVTAAVLVAMVPLLLGPTLLFVRERPPRDVPGVRMPLREAGLVLAGNGPFLRLLAVFTMVFFTIGLGATVAVPWLRNVMGLSEAGTYGLLLIHYTTTVVSIPAWIAVANRTSKHGTTAFAFLAKLALAVAVFVALLASREPWIAFAFGTIDGLITGALVGIPAAMGPDVVDVDTWRSGKQRTGLYYAAFGMAFKLAIGIGVAVAGVAVTAIGFDMSAGAAVPPRTAIAVTAVYVLVPNMLNAALVPLLWSYPLTRRRHRALRWAIDRRVP